MTEKRKDQSAVQGSRTCVLHEFAKASKNRNWRRGDGHHALAQERLTGRRLKRRAARKTLCRLCFSLQTAARRQRSIFAARPKPVSCQRPCQATKRGASGKLRNSNRLRCAERHREFPARLAVEALRFLQGGCEDGRIAESRCFSSIRPCTEFCIEAMRQRSRCHIFLCQLLHCLGGL
jgi:hypothetical protein